MARTHANRGKPLEDLITIVNKIYRGNSVAIIDKIPTEWIPLRGRSGKIVGAKVEKKSTVDFTGHYQGIPIAFDAKHTKENAIRWDVLEVHQAEFLSDWQLTGGTSFILVSFNLQYSFAIPWQFWKKGLDNWLDTGNNPNLSMAAIPGKLLIQPRSTNPLDYLAIVKKHIIPCA